MQCRCSNGNGFLTEPQITSVTMKHKKSTQDAAAVERAKLALVEQVSLRGLASRRAQELRKEDQLSARVTPWSLFTEDDDEILEEGGEQQRKDAVEISELELKIDASSQVLSV